MMRKVLLDWYPSSAMKNLSRWIQIVSNVQETGKPVVVTHGSHAHLAHPFSHSIPKRIDWTDKVADHTPVEGGQVDGLRVLRAFFSPASREDSKRFLKTYMDADFPDDLIVARRGTGEFKDTPDYASPFSHTILFNTISKFSGEGWVVAHSSKFKKDDSRRLPDGIRFCRVWDSLSAFSKLVGTYDPKRNREARIHLEV